MFSIYRILIKILWKVENKNFLSFIFKKSKKFIIVWMWYSDI